MALLWVDTEQVNEVEFNPEDENGQLYTNGEGWVVLPDADAEPALTDADAPWPVGWVQMGLTTD